MQRGCSGAWGGGDDVGWAGWAEPPAGAAARAASGSVRRRASALRGARGWSLASPGAGGRGSRVCPGRRAVVCAGGPRLPRGSQRPGRVRPRSPVGAVSTLNGGPEPTHGKSRVSGRGRACRGVSSLVTTDAAGIGPRGRSDRPPRAPRTREQGGTGVAPCPQGTASVARRCLLRVPGWRPFLRPQ